MHLHGLVIRVGISFSKKGNKYLNVFCFHRNNPCTSNNIFLRQKISKLNSCQHEINKGVSIIIDFLPNVLFTQNEMQGEQ